MIKECVLLDMGDEVEDYFDSNMNPLKSKSLPKKIPLFRGFVVPNDEGLLTERDDFLAKVDEYATGSFTLNFDIANQFGKVPTNDGILGSTGNLDVYSEKYYQTVIYFSDGIYIDISKLTSVLKEDKSRLRQYQNMLFDTLYAREQEFYCFVESWTPLKVIAYEGDEVVATYIDHSPLVPLLKLKASL